MFLRRNIDSRELRGDVEEEIVRRDVELLRVEVAWFGTRFAADVVFQVTEAFMLDWGPIGGRALFEIAIVGGGFVRGFGVRMQRQTQQSGERDQL